MSGSPEDIKHFVVKARAVSRGGGSGGSAEPPLHINDIHNYCYAFEKLRAEMYVYIYCIIHLLFMPIQHILRIS